MSERRPISELPLDLICPACGDGPFKTESGLRGHAWGKHQIKWELRPKPKVSKGGKPVHKFKEYDDPEFTLKPWHRIAILRRALLGENFTEIAEKVGYSPNTISDVYKSPAGQEFREEIEGYIDDTPFMIRAILQSMSANLLLDDMLAYQWAKDAKDYKEVHRMTTDLWEFAGIEPDHGTSAEPQVIVLRLDTDQLTLPEVETSHERLEAEIVGDS